MVMLIKVAMALSAGLLESGLHQQVNKWVGFLLRLYFMPSRKYFGKRLSASMNSRHSPFAALAPRFLWVETFRLLELIIFKFSLLKNLLAFFMVLSWEWPSTNITSKPLKVWLTKSWRSRGRVTCSLSAGMMMEKEGFI